MSRALLKQLLINTNSPRGGSHLERLVWFPEGGGELPEISLRSIFTRSPRHLKPRPPISRDSFQMNPPLHPETMEDWSKACCSLVMSLKAKGSLAVSFIFTVYPFKTHMSRFGSMRGTGGGGDRDTMTARHVPILEELMV